MKTLPATLWFVGLLALSACSKVDDPTLRPAFDETAVEQPAVKPASAFNPFRNLYFGDLHIHTGLSSDAFVMGARSVPDDVYRFAKGYAIEHAAGYPLQISRPLDFAAVTDHAEYLGHARQAGLDIPTTRRPLRELLLQGNALTITLAWFRTTLGFREEGWGIGVDEIDPAVFKSAWRETIDAAERHNQPGIFSAFIGYEWSASAGDIATHIHRNVIYRSNEVAELPFSSLDSNRPEDLWAFLSAEEQQGRVAMAIPHNANVSKGNMYAAVDSDGKPLSRDYAATRNYYEPISEILQIKGASETHPLLSNLDEFADFAIAQMEPGAEPDLQAVRGSYARDALRLGIELSHREGFNPYKFGVIGASDSHNASSPAEESDFTGKLPMMDGSAGLRTSEALLLPVSYNPVSSWASGGLSGVWAEENTRASIFDALRRKETYASSGPRLSLRMFGGWHLNQAMLTEPDVFQQAYSSGIPMGGTLLQAEQSSGAPGFLVFAAKDPQGANLDRVQIIKGWVDNAGASHEKIYNIAVSDERNIDPSSGAVEPVGNTVDVGTATYKNTVGSSQFNVFWQDPDFNPNQQAFYYARVLEIPTPRWSTYDAVKLGSEPMEPATIQERAIGSAIWYKP